MEDYIKCELIGGELPSHLNIFSNLFNVVEDYTHKCMLCIDAIVDCTYHIQLVAVHYKISSTHYILLLLLTAPI